MDVTQMILSQLGEGGLEKIAGQIGANPDQAKKALEGAVPALLGAMSSNTRDQKGASGLLGALDRDHDGSIFDDLGGFLGNFEQGPGNGILSHVLGDKRGQVESGLGQKTGLSSGQVGNLLKIVAPLVMGYLGKQKKESGNGFDLGSLTGLLGGLTKSADKGTSLDLGDLLDVVGGLGGSKSKSSGGLGGLLGKLFAK